MKHINSSSFSSMTRTETPLLAAILSSRLAFQIKPGSPEVFQKREMLTKTFDNSHIYFSKADSSFAISSFFMRSNASITRCDLLEAFGRIFIDPDHYEQIFTQEFHSAP